MIRYLMHGMFVHPLASAIICCASDCMTQWLTWWSVRLQRIQAFDKATGLTAVRALAPDWHSSAAQMDQQLQAVRRPHLPPAASTCTRPLCIGACFGSHKNNSAVY